MARVAVLSLVELAMPTMSPKRGVAVKQVLCTHCEQKCDVGHRAMSVVCPHCNKRLILEDFRITGYHAVREFVTCGDVVVEKSGHVVALCKVGSLAVKGKVQGDVTARGRVSVHKTGLLKGDVRSPALRVESGAKLAGFLRIGETAARAE